MLDLSNNRFLEICGRHMYLQTIVKLDFSRNEISRVCEDTVTYMETGSIVELNLANNSITSLSSDISNVSSLQIVKLSGNRFICDCTMTWMIKWFSKRNLNGEIIVKDYQDVVCCNGIMKGKLIYNLSVVEMGCYTQKFSTREKITISIFGTLTIVLIIAIIAISGRWNEVKFFLYLYFDILDKNNGDEDLTTKFYDIFVSYRYVTFVDAN